MATVSDLSRVVTGPAEVLVDGISVGRTAGPVRARFTPLLREETYACTGGTPADFVVVGLRAEVVVPLAEYVLENVLLAMPGALETYGYARLGPLPGGRLAGGAFALTIHPLSLADEDNSEDVTLHSAVAVAVTELEYSGEADRLVEACFVGLADVGRADGDLVARVRAPYRG
jgi:hypothetical protein